MLGRAASLITATFWIIIPVLALFSSDAQAGALVRMVPVRPVQVAGHAAAVPEKGVLLAHEHLPAGLMNDEEESHVSEVGNEAPGAQVLHADLHAGPGAADTAAERRGSRAAPVESVCHVDGKSRDTPVRRERWGGAAPNDPYTHAGQCGRTTGRHVHAPLKYSRNQGCIDDRNNDSGTPIHIPA